MRVAAVVFGALFALDVLGVVWLAVLVMIGRVG